MLTIYKRDYVKKLIRAKLEQQNIPGLGFFVSKIDKAIDEMGDDGICICKADSGSPKLRAAMQDGKEIVINPKE